MKHGGRRANGVAIKLPWVWIGTHECEQIEQNTANAIIIPQIISAFSHCIIRHENMCDLMTVAVCECVDRKAIESNATIVASWDPTA